MFVFWGIACEDPQNHEARQALMFGACIAGKNLLFFFAPFDVKCEICFSKNHR